MTTALSVIRSMVLTRAGLAADDPRFTSSSLTDAVNQALRSISAEHDWPWLQTFETITTVAGTQTDAVPADWAKTIRMEINGDDLHLMQPRDGSQYSADTGKPLGYFLEADTIYFVPVPDGVHSVRHVYYKYETALSADGDTPALPDRFLDWLIWSAVIEVAVIIRDTDLYSMADRERKVWRTLAHSDVQRSVSPFVPKTRSDWGI